MDVGAFLFEVDVHCGGEDLGIGGQVDHLLTRFGPLGEREGGVETALEMRGAVRREFERASIAILCAAVADFLRRAGYPKAVNLAGGLDEWAQAIDPSMRRY